MRTSSRHLRHGPRARTRPDTGVTAARVTAAVACAGVLLAACADFEQTTAESDWGPAPELTPQQGPQPDLPEAEDPEQPDPPDEDDPEPVPPPDGCTDFDPAVIATCLEPVGDVAALPPDGAEVSALAAERETGVVYRVSEEPGGESGERGGSGDSDGNGDGGTEADDAEEFATLDVDDSDGGGLTGLALSPTYAEDQLVYAYISTEDDNRVVRFGEDGEATPVLTGIPKGDSGNSGALAVDRRGSLLVATGDAGDPEEAEDADSLAGKVLRIDNSGEAAEGNPDPGSPVIAAGLHEPGGLCTSADGARSWVTDRGPDADALHQIEPGEDLTSPAWRWTDRPGVAGCGDWSDVMTITTAEEPSIQTMPLDDDGTVTGVPQVTDTSEDEEGGYGRLSGLDVLGEELAVAGTVNRDDGGDPVSSDDRVVLLPRPDSGAGGAD